MSVKLIFKINHLCEHHLAIDFFLVKQSSLMQHFDASDDRPNFVQLMESYFNQICLQKRSV
jgi:hypothetical protein